MVGCGVGDVGLATWTVPAGITHTSGISKPKLPDSPVAQHGWFLLV